MISYRHSHVGKDSGTRYDQVHAGKIDSLIWDGFVKRYVGDEFAACAASGAARYLDFACGTGRLLKLGARYFGQSVGIDISPDMLEVARARVPSAELHLVDVTASPGFEPGRFDCVTLFRFLLNAEDDLRHDVLRWINAHLSDDGILIGNHHMETWSVGGLVTAAAGIVGVRRRNHLSRGEVEAMLRKAGFEVHRWAGFRILPAIAGRPVLGRPLQLRAERIVRLTGLGRFGGEQVFVARKARSK